MHSTRAGRRRSTRHDVRRIGSRPATAPEQSGRASTCADTASKYRPIQRRSRMSNTGHRLRCRGFEEIDAVARISHARRIRWTEQRIGFASQPQRTPRQHRQSCCCHHRKLSRDQSLVDNKTLFRASRKPQYDGAPQNAVNRGEESMQKLIINRVPRSHQPAALGRSRSRHVCARDGIRDRDW